MLIGITIAAVITQPHVIAQFEENIGCVPSKLNQAIHFVISFCMRRKKWIETEKEISLVLLNVIKAWIFQTKIVVPRALPGPDKTNADDESIRPCTNRTGCLPGAGIRCNPKM